MLWRNVKSDKDGDLIKYPYSWDPKHCARLIINAVLVMKTGFLADGTVRKMKDF